ncbi:hypothetical protein DPMN_174006 [Dreissena polymorpha]|uniref:Uncharacterized protein n=1 Tax=Dreissena polymorpha TaxID=45954 RepID=A0A9D4E5N0_DREPO|nr:hypothetical protein DPMN_174006 [Dreissena polymorpha]
MCMFCQEDTNEKLHEVQQFSRSTDILNRAKCDDIMRARLSGIGDLMAAKGKYHNKCLNEFKRRTNEKSSSAKSEVDAAMEHLIEQLDDGLMHGHVFDMVMVWKTHTDI